MPYPDLGIHGTSSSDRIHADESDQPFMLLTSKKRLTRPYSSSHIQASLRRLDSDAVNQQSRTMIRRTTAVNEGVNARLWIGNSRASSNGLHHVSPTKTRAKSAICKGVVDMDDELATDYRRIADEDPDRMTESDVYHGVRKLNTQNYEHDSLRGGISPSIVQASKKLQASKYASVTVVRIGSKYHDGLKVTGIPINMKMNSMPKDDDTLSECSISSGDICQCRNCQEKKMGQELLDEEIDDTLLKDDASPTLMVVSKALSVTTPVKRPSSNTQHNRRNYSKDVMSAQDHKDQNNKRSLSRCNSARVQVFSPPTLKIDSNNLPVVASRSITGPRMRYEVTSSLSTKSLENDNDSICSGSENYLNKQIEAVAKAQGTIEHYPSVDDESTTTSSEIPIFSWRPALKDILHSKSVSLRLRSRGCIYADSMSTAKCLKHGRKCPEIPKTAEDNVYSQYPSSHVWSRGRRLKISIDMRSICLPPILSYSQRSLESRSNCVACVAGVSC